MRLICIFKGTKLLEHSDYFHRETAYYLKENTAIVHGFDREELDAFYFEDEDLKQFMSNSINMPKKFIEIERGKIRLIEIVSTPKPIMAELDWKNCNEEMLEEHFTTNEIEKINENKAYYETLGNEKYETGYQIQWPHDINKPMIQMTGSSSDRHVVKELIGELIETPEPVFTETVQTDDVVLENNESEN